MCGNMDTRSTISMDWSNLQFKAKDILLYSAYLLPAIFFINQVTNSVERQGEKITELQAQVVELKNEGKGNSKESQAFLQSIQVQVNAINTQLRVLEQRVTMNESNIAR